MFFCRFDFHLPCFGSSSSDAEVYRDSGMHARDAASLTRSLGSAGSGQLPGKAGKAGHGATAWPSIPAALCGGRYRRLHWGPRHLPKKQRNKQNGTNSSTPTTHWEVKKTCHPKNLGRAAQCNLLGPSIMTRPAVLEGRGTRFPRVPITQNAHKRTITKRGNVT